MKLRTWPWLVTVGRGFEKETFVVHASHRAEAKRLASEQVDWTPGRWYCSKWKPSERTALERAAEEIEVATLEAVVVAVLLLPLFVLWAGYRNWRETHG
jgi:hypothetical protein